MKYRLAYKPEKCSGCLQCQLTCSFMFSRVFQLSAAHIQIHIKGAVYRAMFTDQCTQCGLCADNCLFGALTKSKSEVTN